MTKNYEIIDAKDKIVKISEVVETNKERILSVEAINDRIAQIDSTISELNIEKTELQNDLSVITQLLA